METTPKKKTVSDDIEAYLRRQRAMLAQKEQKEPVDKKEKECDNIDKHP